jgi:MFS family permease
VNLSSGKIQNTYLLLLLLHTLAASFIWGINTLFLLDAGLSNVEAFTANAFFTAGMVLFEVPTGMVADTRGRRTSYLLGTFTLAISTLLYLFMWRVSAAERRFARRGEDRWASTLSADRMRPCTQGQRNPID